MSVIDLLPIALLGGFLGMDVVTFPQAMISRPIVAATVAGAFVGDATAGLVIGAVLELFALEMLPFGASRYPEWGSASVVGGAVYAGQIGDPRGALAAALLASLMTAAASGWSMVRLRRLNGSRAAFNREALEEGDSSAVIGTHLFGLNADLLRGCALTFVAMLLFDPLVPAIVAQWKTDAPSSRGVVVAIAAAVSAGAIWKVFHTVAHARFFLAAGLATGAVLVLTR